MDIYEIRRLNLDWFIEKYFGGNVAAFARFANINDKYVRRLLLPEGRNQKRRIADQMLTKLLIAMEKPAGWLDNPQFINVYDIDLDKDSYVTVPIDGEVIACENAGFDNKGAGDAQMLLQLVVDHYKIKNPNLIGILTIIMESKDLPDDVVGNSIKKRIDEFIAVNEARADATLRLEEARKTKT